MQLDPEKKGVNLVINPSKNVEKARLTMSLTNIPLSEALLYVAGLSNCELRVEDHAFVLLPSGE
jgi:hypothetical protein